MTVLFVRCVIGAAGLRTVGAARLAWRSRQPKRHTSGHGAASASGRVKMLVRRLDVLPPRWSRPPLSATIHRGPRRKQDPWQVVRPVLGIVSLAGALAACGPVPATPLVAAPSTPTAVAVATSPTPAPLPHTATTTPTLARPTATPNLPATITALPRPSYTALVHLFDYDPHAPLDIQEASVQAADDVRVHDLSYASPKGGRVPAYLVVPQGPGPFAGVIVQHGTGLGCGDYLTYAKALAKTGVVALLIDAPFTRPVYAKRPNAQGTGFVTFTEQDRDDQIQLIVDLRRAVDLLTARPDVDPARLAYIGHSYGASMGGLLAGVERRIRAYVLACGDGGLVAHFARADDPSSLFRQVPPAYQERWLAAMAPIEPIHFVGHAAPAALFFQAGRRDQFIPKAEAVRWQEAGSVPKQVTWYDADHFLNAAAIRDEVAWLQSQIGIDSHRFVEKVTNLQPDTGQ